MKLLFGNSESQVTKDGEYNKVLNGIPDWVYEEEFSFNRAFDFSADSKMIAYIRFDESQVPMFSFPWYKGMAPEKSQYATYPGAYEYKYPKAGEMNSKVSVHTYDIKSHVTRKMDLPLDEDGYIPRIKFTSDPEKTCHHDTEPPPEPVRHLYGQPEKRTVQAYYTRRSRTVHQGTGLF